MTDDAAREAWRTILDLVRHGEAHDRLRQVCRSTGIPPNMIRALLQLSGNRPRAMRELADCWGCDASYVTSLIDDLEERGFAERRPHPTDRRVKTVVLTPEGAEIRDLVTSRLWEPPPAFSALSPADQRRLRDLLLRVARADAVLGSPQHGAGW